MIFRLKSLIVLKFGRPIEKRSDCEALALHIEIAVGHHLGYNTLRPCFQTIRQIHPSEKNQNKRN
jgi:hypothetical protein